MAQERRKFSANIPVPQKLNISDESGLRANWRRFLRSWGNYELASNLVSETSQIRCAVLLTVIGDEAMEKFDGFKFEQNEKDDDIDTVLKKFESYCIGATHEAFESYRFHSRVQETNETIEGYVAELRILAKGCNFGGFEDRMIRDRILVGCKSDHVREELLKDPTLNLKKAIDIAKAYEASQTKLSEMKDVSVDRVKAKYGKKKEMSKKDQSQKTQGQGQKTQKCGRCGYNWHKRYKDCPALNEKCLACGRKGHFRDQCRAEKDVRQIEEDEDDDFMPILGSISEDSEGINTVVENKWHTNLKVNGQDMEFRIDTGADVSVIPDRCFKNKDVLKKTEKKLFGPGGTKIEVVGVYRATIEKNQSKKTDQNLYVVKGLKKPLLGKPAIEALDIIQINSLQSETKTKETKTDSDTDSSKIDPKTDYPSLFEQKIGTFSSYKIEQKADAKPFHLATPRRLPLPLKDKVEEELKSLQEQGIIRPVTKPTDWCAPIVAVTKPNGKVRICCDFSKLNESVKRENFPLPTTDQLLAQIDGAKVFSKLDCHKGFHQIPLHPDSQELTTFITPFGRFCYERLPFGINSGPEVFHREMTRVLDGIPGVIVDIDDVLVGGKDQKDHDHKLKAVLDKMTEAGVTLNEKCEFSVSEVVFLGHVISADGIRVDPKKVEAISAYPTPTDVPELRRLLGMVNHVGKFTPNLAEVTQPLRELLKKDNDWTWGQTQQTAFETVKRLLSSAPTLQHYGPSKPTKVSADASKFGIGGVLLQKDKEGWKPVFYASRSLTETEQRYAQIEKEALAMTWACERFEDFLVGLKTFTIETDHKPLLSLMKSKSLDLLTPRIQRFRMRMLRFTYDLEFVAGKNLVTADALSRAPVGKGEKDEELESDNFVNSVFSNIDATDKRLLEVKKAQEIDPEISKIISYCLEDFWPDNAKKEFSGFHVERYSLAVVDGMLLHGGRLVIPQALRSEMLERVHQGHQGIVKCRALARTCIWWPGMSKEIGLMVEKCAACEKYRQVPPEPLIPTPTPEYAWQHVASDLFEWSSEWYLLVVDYYSRWIEIFHLTNLTSRTVINSFKAIFARLGIPESVFSDEGTQYTSTEFQKFSQYWGFQHNTSSPKHPSGNGEAERAVQTVKNLLKKEQDPFIALLNYRNTPLASGKSPAELMLGRKLRTRIPLYRSKTSDAEFRRRDALQKARMKANFDKRHRVRELPVLKPGQPVWIKTPRTEEGVVVKRSVDVQTSSGHITRRNRTQLRIRDPNSRVPVSSPPKDTSQLPTLGIPEREVAEREVIDIPDLVIEKPSEENPRPSVTTRSGRNVKPVVKLNL